MNRTKVDDLEAFARRIDEMLAKGKSRESVARLICRHLTAEDPKIAALLLVKWVEWRYGKVKERHEHTGPDGVPIAHTVHTIRFGDGCSDKS